MGSQMSGAFCFSCFDGLGRTSTGRSLEKVREGRKPSKPCIPAIEAATPEVKPLRRRCWSCCRRAPKPKKVSCGTYSCEDGISCPTLDELDIQQRDQLAEMRSRLQKLRWPKRHDLWLKRFLAHKKWNLDNALKAYVEMEEWREKVGADDILTQCPDGNLNSVLPVDVTGFYPYGVDKKGRLVIWMSTGHVPWWRSLFERTDEALKAQLWAGELIYAQQAQLAKLTGVWRERAVVLVDLSHLDFNYFQGLSSSSRARRRGSGHTTAQYYPGVVDKAYLLHAPSFATRAWSILKFFLSEKLMDKAVLVSSDSELSEMLRDLGAENVPRSLGGQSHQADLQLPTKVMRPREGFGKLLAAWKPQEISIPAGQQHEELLLAPWGSVSWQWALISSSISFSVQRQTRSGTWEDVLHPMECHFHDLEEPIFGQAAAEDATEYRFLWDNRASHWSKKLLLRLDTSKCRAGRSP